MYYKVRTVCMYVHVCMCVQSCTQLYVRTYILVYMRMNIILCMYGILCVCMCVGCEGVQTEDNNTQSAAVAHMPSTMHPFS